MERDKAIAAGVFLAFVLIFSAAIFIIFFAIGLLIQ